MFVSLAVYIDTTNDLDVSWKWRQCWSSNTARCHILQKDEMQRLNDELSRVLHRSIFKTEAMPNTYSICQLRSL